MRIFGKKIVKIALVSEVPPPKPHLSMASGGRPQTPRCYSRLLLQPCRVLALNAFIISSKKNKITPVESSTLILPHFCNYFSR